MSKLLQHNIEAIHRLTIIEGVPVMVFTRDELSEETLLPSGKFEIFWYANLGDRLIGSMEVLPNLDNIEEEVKLALQSAEINIKERK